MNFIMFQLIMLKLPSSVFTLQACSQVSRSENRFSFPPQPFKYFFKIIDLTTIW